MSETYQSTNKKSEDTKPERRRLIHSGTMSVGNFASYDGGYWASNSIDITNFNQVKSVWEEIGPCTFDVEVMHTIQESGEFSYFRKVPYYRRFDPAGGGGTKTNWCYTEITNQTSIGVFYSTLRIDYYTGALEFGDKSSAYWTQYFHYKIWSTLYTI